LIERGISSDEHIASFASQATKHPSKERMLEIISDSRFIDIITSSLRPLLEKAWDDK
jgi:hypothetical protein